MPRVSVVIPTYNRSEFLLEAVRSVLAQTFSDLEVIVADDGSSDSSARLVEELADDRVKVVRLAHTGLPAAVRNAGLQCARGEFLAFLDSDDVWDREKLERQLVVFDRDLEVGLVCSNARVVDESGRETRALYLTKEAVTSNSLAGLVKVNFVVISSAVARRELVERVGGFTEDIRLRGVEDYDLWLRIGAISRLAYLPEPLLAYRRHEGSIMAGVPMSHYWTSVLAAFENLDKFLEDDDPEQSTLLRRRRAELLTELARAEAVERRPASAIRSLAGAMRLDPAAATSLLLSGSRPQWTSEALRRALRKSSAPR
jgi:glycosyltransferase involved in cell wall biosynthesis